MQRFQYLPALVFGIGLGIGLTFFTMAGTRPVAAGNDRHENYIICTGAAGVSPKSPLDGVWLLDYKAGKLLATIVDRSVGKTVGFAETDLVSEFGVGANQNVHFVMTTGTISGGQAALYLAETTSGKFAVYTMGPSSDGASGVTILRHDMTTFRRSGS
ncbi:MAG: hypothetical protein ACJ8C4_21145 [Gemmataceae bacterium]